MEPKPTNPHEIEGHTQAHREAFDHLMNRIGKALQRHPERDDSRTPFAGRTHRAYTRFSWDR